MRMRKRPDAKTGRLYPEDVVASIGSSPKPPFEQEEEEVSSKPGAASEADEEKDPELERRKYKHLGWPSSITFSFIQTKTPTQDSSTNPDNNEDSKEDEIQSKIEKNKKRLSKTICCSSMISVIGGGSGYVEDKKYQQFYDCKM
ncbi:hypothetical protein SLEP1_g7679 [Rubroshorea leprosula]|uniref:Uncharacterized protein n=1 Tax=Rubroshorea leprosula TaxID=152421 RepID=A0AAV5IA74_9ROSI|nr:hypothetical protein SLEP1_g7679 [Rubroshorea leprosula]